MPSSRRWSLLSSPAAAAVLALAGNKRRTTYRTLCAAGAATEIIPLARGTRGLINRKHGPGAKSLPDLVLGRFSLSLPDFLKVLTQDTAAASIRESMHLILRDDTFRPTDASAAIRNRTPGIHQTFQDSPCTQGQTGQIPTHEGISGTAVTRGTSVPK